MTDWGAEHQHHMNLWDASFWNAAWVTATIPNNPQLAYHGHAKYLSNATTQRIWSIETEHKNPWKIRALFCPAHAYSGSQHPQGAQGELSVNPERLNLEEPPTHELDWTGASARTVRPKFAERTCPSFPCPWQVPFQPAANMNIANTIAASEPSCVRVPELWLCSATFLWRCTLILLTWLVKSR